MAPESRRHDGEVATEGIEEAEQPGNHTLVAVCLDPVKPPPPSIASRSGLVNVTIRSATP
jgi:hypothetical protein